MIEIRQGKGKGRYTGVTVSRIEIPGMPVAMDGEHVQFKRK